MCGDGGAPLPRPLGPRVDSKDGIPGLSATAVSAATAAAAAAAAAGCWVRRFVGHVSIVVFILVLSSYCVFFFFFFKCWQ
jgi:hypothetical protein